jgi:hypothetical protein
VVLLTYQLSCWAAPRQISSDIVLPLVGLSSGNLVIILPSRSWGRPWAGRLYRDNDRRAGRSRRANTAGLPAGDAAGGLLAA